MQKSKETKARGAETWNVQLFPKGFTGRGLYDQKFISCSIMFAFAYDHHLVVMLLGRPGEEGGGRSSNVVLVIASDRAG